LTSYNLGIQVDEGTPAKVAELYAVISKLAPKSNTESLTDVKLEQAIKKLCIPFLRKSAFLVDSCSLSSSFSHQFSEFSSNLNKDEFAALTELLHVPNSINEILSLIPHQQLWIEELFSNAAFFKFFINMTPPLPFQLSKLESDFQDLITRAMSMKCDKCQLVPKSPALCLFCGKVICVNGACCRDIEEVSEATTHSAQCAGRGIIFLVKDCAVFVIRKREGKYVQGCFFPSIYLDKYGEDDLGFVRGKPLFLNAARYEEVRSLALSLNFDDEVMRRDAKRYRI